jgi:hypothetical protein
MTRRGPIGRQQPLRPFLGWQYQQAFRGISRCKMSRSNCGTRRFMLWLAAPVSLLLSNRQAICTGFGQGIQGRGGILIQSRRSPSAGISVIYQELRCSSHEVAEHLSRSAAHGRDSSTGAAKEAACAPLVTRITLDLETAGAVANWPSAMVRASTLLLTRI